MVNITYYLQDLLISSVLLMASASAKPELPETSATNVRQTIGTSQMKLIRVASPVNVWWKEVWEIGLFMFMSSCF